MAVGVVTIVGAMFAVFDKAKNIEYRVERIESVEKTRSDEFTLLSQELKTLNSKLTDLTIELRTMRAKEEILKNKGYE